jgi:hypothetical protein
MTPLSARCVDLCTLPEYCNITNTLAFVLYFCGSQPVSHGLFQGVPVFTQHLTEFCFSSQRLVSCCPHKNKYSGRKITASLGKVTVRGEKRWIGQGGSTTAKCLSMYSITENIYCSQLSSAALLLKPERNCFASYNTKKGLGYLSLCAIVLRSSPPSHMSTCNGQ